MTGESCEAIMHRRHRHRGCFLDGLHFDRKRNHLQMASIGSMNKVRGNAVHCVTPIDLVSMADSQVDIAAAVARRYGKALNDRLVISTNDGKPQWRSKAQRLVVFGFGADPGKVSE